MTCTCSGMTAINIYKIYLYKQKLYYNTISSVGNWFDTNI